MQTALKRPDSTEVELSSLMNKIIEKIKTEEEGDDAALTTQESIRCINLLMQEIPILQAVMTLNQNFATILMTFFKAGYILGKAIKENNLTIEVQREENDNISPDSESNITSSNTYSN